MCGRFTVTTKNTKKVADRFEVELEKALGIEGHGIGGRALQRRPHAGGAHGALLPESERADEGEREALMMRWGLVPRWAKDLKVGYKMINAKTERLTESRAYAPLIGKFRHRCLIVADGFYEWLKSEDPKQPRLPFRFTVDGGEPFAFAGICTRKEWEDDWLYSCTIITTKPNEVVKPVHDRMPVILPSREAEQAWLSTSLTAEDAVAMCVPLDAGRMQSAPANPKLNKVGKGIEGPELLVVPE